MSRILEIRQKKNGSFNDSNSLVYVKTHKSAVIGLLDGSDKIDISILPNSILGASKNAGSIDANITLANALSAIASAMNNQTSLYAGSFLISNGTNQVSSSTGHTIQYNDENGPSYADSATLEHGDHLYLISSNTNTYKWDEVPSKPSGTIKYYESIAARNEDNITGVGTNAAVTGFMLVSTNQAGYDAAPSKGTVTLGVGDSPTFDNICKAIEAEGLQSWEGGDGITGSGIRVTVDGGFHYYYIMGPNGTGGSIKYYTSAVNNNQYIWGVINNTTPLATNTTAGLMSGADKNKLNSLFNYSHPTGGANVNLDGGDIQFVADLTVNNLGHVTAASLGTIRSSSTSATGIVQLATTGEAQTGTNTTKALTVAAGKALVDRFGSLKQYGTIANDGSVANNNHPDEAFALFETGITPAA